MNEEVVIQWLRGNWLAFILAFIPPLIAEIKGRRRTRWYLYGLACTLLAWPLLSLPTTHVLLLRRRNGMSEQLSLKRRRADALALLGEDSVRSYPSWIAILAAINSGGRFVAQFLPMNTLERARHLNSSASTPIRKVITPCPITIVLFTSVMSLNNIIGLLRR